jgi:hypothetical protein
MLMPFGPHQGLPIADLPTRYLRWIVSDVNQADHPELVAAAKDELKFRDDFKRETEVTL